MASLIYDKAEVQRRLCALTPNSGLAFASSCCERLLPNYSVFRSEVNWGNDAPLRQALDRLWALSSGAAVQPNEISNLTAQCEAVAPDAEDFDSLFTASAQDAVLAICSALDFVSTNDILKLVQCSSYAIDTVDLYVQEIDKMPANSPDLETRIRNHHLMQREIKHQYGDLSQLELSVPIDVVKMHSTDNGKSNIGM